MERARRIRVHVLVAALGCLLASSALGARPALALSCQSWDTTCLRLQQAQLDQQSVQNRLSQIQQSLTDIQQKSTAIAQLLQTLKTQIDQQKKVIAATQRKLDDTNRQIRYTEADISRRQAQLEVRQQLLDQRVRAMDKHDSLNYFELVVTSQSFNQLVDRLTTMQDIIRADQGLIDQLRQARFQIQQQQTRLQAQRDQQAALLQQQQQQNAQLEQTLAAQQAALAYDQELEAQYQQQAQALAAENQQLAGQIQQLQQQYDNEARGFGGGSGRFAWPQSGAITQPFGCSDLVLEPYDPGCPTRHFHQGLDIAAPFGNPIGAGDAGIVASVVTGCGQGYFYCGGGYGNQVIIVHGNGYSTLYAHLSAVFVSPGQAVRRGQTIGQEGSTGASTGPHLHFGVLYNGRWVDPQAYLA
jgi:murein DD-endopeptidase MepM/ murein hydrolase activator NlpD